MLQYQIITLAVWLMFQEYLMPLLVFFDWKGVGGFNWPFPLFFKMDSPCVSGHAIFTCSQPKILFHKPSEFKQCLRGAPDDTYKLWFPYIVPAQISGATGVILLEGVHSRNICSKRAITLGQLLFKCGVEELNDIIKMYFF